MQLIFVDTETTGNDVTKDRLVQICYKVDGQNHCYTAYFKPPLPMSVKAMSVTHITNSMLEDKPVFADSQMMQDLQKLLDEGVMVAHNAVFDKAILEAEGMSVPRYICTMRLAMHFDTKGAFEEFNLQYLRYFLELEVDGHPHDAENDVKTCEALFRRLYARAKGEYKTDDETINKLIEISCKPSLYKRFTFGKYKGELIEDVLKSDRNYLEWALNKKAGPPGSEEDWAYTLEHYLHA